MAARYTSFVFVLVSFLSSPAVAQDFSHDKPVRVDLHGDPLPPGAVARLGTVRLRHIVRDGSGAAGITFSPDGKMLVSCGDVGVRVWDVASGKRLADPFSNEDKKLMNQLFQRQKQEGFANSSALSPDGKIRVSASGNGAQLIDVASGREIGAIQSPNEKDRTEVFSGFVFSPDATILAGSGNDSLIAWDVENGELLYQVKKRRGRLAFSKDGKYLACGGEGEIRLFDAAAGKEARVFQPHSGFVHALAFSPDGKLLASVQDYVVSLWDVAGGKRLLAFPGNESPVVSLAFSADGASLAAGDSDHGKLTVWNVATRKHRYTCGGHFPGVLSVAFSPDGTAIATGDGYVGGGTGGLDAQVRLWRASDGKLIKQWPGHLNSVQSLAFSPDGRMLASAGHDARARLWDSTTGKRLRQIRGDDSQHKWVGFADDGKAVVLAGTSGELSLWRADSGQKIRDLGPAGREVAFGAFLPGGKTLLSIEQLGRRLENPPQVRLWDADSGKSLQSFPVRADGFFPNTFALSPDGKTLATLILIGSYQRSDIQLWDTDTGKVVVRLPGHDDSAIVSLAFSPDGKLLASGGRDTTVLLWNISRARIAHIWSELISGQDETAKAAQKMAAHSKEAVSFLRDRLRLVAEVESQTRALIGQLGSDQFKVREKASKELQKLGADAALPLQLALRQPNLSLETRRRIEVLLSRLRNSGNAPPDSEPRSIQLSFSILEEINNSEARQALRDLAEGPADTTVTRAARATLNRLKKSPK